MTREGRGREMGRVSSSWSEQRVLPFGVGGNYRNSHHSMMLNKQFQNLQLEVRKLLQEINVLKLQQDKLKLDMQLMGE